MIDYTNPEIWNTIWSRPYKNYEKHHQVFWNKILSLAHGNILDIACGSASVWRGTTLNVYGVDFSSSAIAEASKNCPHGKFKVGTIPEDLSEYSQMQWDTIVLCGLVNYYRDLTYLKSMLKCLSHKGTIIIVTINVIKDFPDREWDFQTIMDEFLQLGKIEAEFIDKIGWFITIKV